MALTLSNMAINRLSTPPTAHVQLSDEDNCSVMVQVKLEGKPVERFTLQEVTDLARGAAKHLVEAV